MITTAPAAADRRPSRLRPSVRTMAGLAFLVHGVGHLLPGMTAAHPEASGGVLILAATVWAVTTSGFLGAGMGLLGVTRLRAHWRWLAGTGAIASLVLLALVDNAAMALPGAVIDALVLGLLFHMRSRDGSVSVDSEREA